MNIEYLTKEVLPVRKQEIERGANGATANPIYIVYSLTEYACEGWVSVEGTNLKRVPSKHVLVKRDGDDVKTVDLDKALEAGMDEDDFSNKWERWTEYFVDTLVGFFLTREAAEAYMQYQKHNLSNPYIYVHYTGYANRQMNQLFSKKK